MGFDAQRQSAIASGVDQADRYGQCRIRRAMSRYSLKVNHRIRVGDTFLEIPGGLLKSPACNGTSMEYGAVLWICVDLT